NGGHSHAAQEAQFGEAVLHGGVTGQVTGLVFLVGDAVDIAGDGLGADVGRGHIHADEVDVGVLLRGPGQRGSVQVTDADNGVGAVVDRVADQGLAPLVVVVAGQIVLNGNAVGLAESLDG